jgi:hypothetical protein
MDVQPYLQVGDCSIHAFDPPERRALLDELYQIFGPPSDACPERRGFCLECRHRGAIGMVVLQDVHPYPMS